MTDNIDPRFDPAFQRGYEPGEDARPTAVPIAAPSASSSRPVPASVPAAEAERRTAAPVAEPATPRASYDSFGFEEQEVPVDVRRARNPFLIALGVIAVVITGSGLFLVSRLRDLFADTQSSTDFDYVTLQVLIIAAPLLVCLGLATGIGVLFVLAARRRSR